MNNLFDNTLYSVSKEVFYQYITSNNLKKQQGSNFHSDEFIDNEGNVKAYRESSSYSTSVCYQISDENYSNLETLNIITNFLNN